MRGCVLFVVGLTVGVTIQAHPAQNMTRTEG
jgi:hypothetical protein